MKPASYFDYVDLGEKFLKLRGIDEARISSERLLEKALSKDKTELFLEKELCCTKEERNCFYNYLRKRADFYPLQYILQKASFRNLELRVREGVLIPRSETELLIDAVHRLFPPNKSLKILDLGSGSGNIALSLVDEFSESRVVSVDCSRKALEIAKENADYLGFQEKINFFKSNLFEKLSTNVRFDLIVSNPPYVSLEEKECLQKEVRFEPETALFAGSGGLDVIEVIMGDAKKYLNSKGFVILEIGKGQADRIKSLAGKYGYKVVSIDKDYSGIERIVTLWKN